MGKRLSLATENTVLFFFPPVIVAVLYGYFTFEAPLVLKIGVAVAVPALACLLMSFLIALFPVLATRYTLAVCAMLPVLHLAVMMTLVFVATTPASALVRIPVELEPACMWLKPLPLVAAYLGEFALFCLAHLRGAPSS